MEINDELRNMYEAKSEICYHLYEALRVDHKNLREINYVLEMRGNYYDEYVEVVLDGDGDNIVLKHNCYGDNSLGIMSEILKLL